MIEKNEQMFKCKINSKIFYTKIQLMNKQININIKVNSIDDDEYSEYYNNYNLSHLYEINTYFKLFNNIKDTYKDLIKIMKARNFIIIENEDKTLTFSIKIQINDKIRNINLTLTKKNIRKENNLKLFNYKISDLEDYRRLQTTPNNFGYGYNLTGHNPLDGIISKINQLENDNEEKNERIEYLENKINSYKMKENKFNNFLTLDGNKKNNIAISTIKYSNNYNYNKSNLILNENYPNNYAIYHDNYNVPKTSRNQTRPYKSVEKNYCNDNEDNIKKRSKLKSLPKNSKINNNNINTNKPKNDNILPIVKRENILNLNSRIIFTNQEVKLIMKKLSNGTSSYSINLKLLYRASIDGDYEGIIKMNCKNTLKTLTLFYTTEGARFGVYTEKYIRKSVRKGDRLFEVPGSSFIIGLNKLIYYNVLAKRLSLYRKCDNELCFGFCTEINKNQTNWLIYTSRNRFLGKKFIFGDKNDVYLNLDYRNIIGNNPVYILKDVEIFDVIIESGNNV